MKNYLKLHRLAFRQKVAHAAFLEADEELRRREADLRQLQLDHTNFSKDYRHVQISAREPAMAKIEASLERAIAVRDIAAEEKQRTKETYEAATAAYRSVRSYLEDNRQLIPEGIPNGI